MSSVNYYLLQGRHVLHVLWHLCMNVEQLQAKLLIGFLF